MNTFIKRHLPLKCSFIAKSSAPQRLCARSQCLRQFTARPPSTTFCSLRGAVAQSERIHQGTSSSKKLFHRKKLCARLQCPRQLTAQPPTRRSFRAEAQRRRVNTISKRHLPLKMLFYCKKLCASAPLREITVPTPLPSSYMFNCLSLKMPVPFRTIQKIHTNCCFRAEAQSLTMP